jgi:serine kinase of HPr protein (carbohydrate metabolism regulator)
MVGQSPKLRVDGVAVAIGENALLLRGPVGSGRSDLALRLVDEGALLISDEQVELQRAGDALLAGRPSAMPAHLVGRLEARGLGIVPLPHATRPLPLRWIADLMPQGEIERMPIEEQAAYLGVCVPVVRIDPAAPSATARLRLVMRCGPDQILGRT